MSEALLTGFPLPGRMLSRRELIGGVAVLAVAAALPNLGRVTNRWSGSEVRVFDRSDFESLVGESFVLRGAPLGVRSLELHQVRADRFAPPQAKEAAGSRSFSLLFRSPSTRALGQDVYQLQHRSLGAMSLLMVPMQPDSGGNYLEAVFNHAVPR